ncbi:hypothetical protein Fmac_028918 [Flemingia macrophylla]|uniref:Uncharacterized protein n=1 Tax=Flemingia macrophylla TaxID=520843 RepID=A0ABD1L8W3_9FABA
MSGMKATKGSPFALGMGHAFPDVSKIKRLLASQDMFILNSLGSLFFPCVRAVTYPPVYAWFVPEPHRTGKFRPTNIVLVFDITYIYVWHMMNPPNMASTMDNRLPTRVNRLPCIFHPVILGCLTNLIAFTINYRRFLLASKNKLEHSSPVSGTLDLQDIGPKPHDGEKLAKHTNGVVNDIRARLASGPNHFAGLNEQMGRMNLGQERFAEQQDYFARQQDAMFAWMQARFPGPSQDPPADD